MFTRSLVYAFTNRLNILWQLSYCSGIIWTFWVKRRLHRFVWLNTCQNATLLESHVPAHCSLAQLELMLLLLQQHSHLMVQNHHIIFTFPPRVFMWTFTFEMWFIPSWTNRFKPHPYARHLSGLTPSPANNFACLLTFAWRWTRIAMTLSAEIWRFGYSKPYVMSDLIQNIWKTSQVRWKLKIDT